MTDLATEGVLLQKSHVNLDVGTDLAGLPRQGEDASKEPRQFRRGNTYPASNGHVLISGFKRATSI